MKARKITPFGNAIAQSRKIVPSVIKKCFIEKGYFDSFDFFQELF